MLGEAPPQTSRKCAAIMPDTLSPAFRSFRLLKTNTTRTRSLSGFSTLHFCLHTLLLPRGARVLQRTLSRSRILLRDSAEISCRQISCLSLYLRTSSLRATKSPLSAQRVRVPNLKRPGLSRGDHLVAAALR